MKIVINTCFGGFGLSHVGVMKYAELKGITLYSWLDEITLKYTPTATVFDDNMLVHYATVPCEQYKKHNAKWHAAKIEDRAALGDGGYFSECDIKRDDPALIEVVRTLGEKAYGGCASLGIVEIPDGTDWQIEEYDGNEYIAEKHNTWS